MIKENTPIPKNNEKFKSYYQTTADIEMMIKRCCEMIKEKGDENTSFYLIYPTNEFDNILNFLKLYEFNYIQYRLVFHRLPILYKSFSILKMLSNVTIFKCKLRKENNIEELIPMYIEGEEKGKENRYSKEIREFMGYIPNIENEFCYDVFQNDTIFNINNYNIDFS